ncbi:MAG TPA: hypothetical protein VID76_03540 [Solirubrobacterales bacterium]|jgi:multidrug transporter EmrE-like cation transporter
MDAGRLGRGELIAAVSGAALFIIMFLPWFGYDFSGAASDVADQLGVSVPDASVNFNAWESFGFIDIVLFVTVIVSVAFGVAGAMARDVALPVAASAITAGLGILSLVLVAYRLLDTPSESSRKFGLFLGLIATAGIAYGGWIGMQEEGTSFGDQVDRVQGDSGDAPPPPPAAPPPPPAAPPSV